jgi:hypothetical protein
MDSGEGLFLKLAACGVAHHYLRYTAPGNAAGLELRRQGEAMLTLLHISGAVRAASGAAAPQSPTSQPLRL